MTDEPVSPQWIDVSQADDLRDVIHRAVACLAQGGVVGLATETVYGLAACALNARSVARVRALRTAEPSRPLTLLLKGPEEVTDWVPRISQVGRRMAWRLWPGPVTLVFSRIDGRRPVSASARRRQCVDLARRATSRCGARRTRSSATCCGSCPPRWSSRWWRRPDHPVPTTAESLRGLAGVDMVIDAGPTQYQQFATVVKIDDDRWTIERQGVVDAATLDADVQPDHPVRLHGEHLPEPDGRGDLQGAAGPPARLHDRPSWNGAGSWSARPAWRPRNGVPAAAHAVEVVRDLGGSLENHRSRKIAANLVRQADCIFAMTGDHLDALLDAVPEVEHRTFLLDPDGGDVADPVGFDHETYRRTAQMIESMLERRLDEMGF